MDGNGKNRDSIFIYRHSCGGVGGVTVCVCRHDRNVAMLPSSSSSSYGMFSVQCSHACSDIVFGRSVFRTRKCVRVCLDDFYISWFCARSVVAQYSWSTGDGSLAFACIHVAVCVRVRRLYFCFCYFFFLFFFLCLARTHFVRCWLQMFAYSILVRSLLLGK